MATHSCYMIRLHPVRREMVDNPTDHEQSVMGEHFQYLKKLTQEGRVLLAGPVFGEPPFGLAVTAALSESDANEIGKNDPSVIAGVTTYDIAPMRVSLIAQGGEN